MKYRDLTIESARAVEADGNKVLTFSFASEAPYKRYDEKKRPYFEVLKCGDENINWERLVDGRCPFCLGHEPEKVIGVVQKAYTLDGRLYADILFSENNYAQNIKKDIEAGIRRNTSVGYRVDESVMVNSVEQGAVPNNEGIPTLLCTKWTPYEFSSVGVPADASIGYQRSEDVQETKTEETEEVKTEEVVIEEVKACTEPEKKECDEHDDEDKACPSGPESSEEADKGEKKEEACEAEEEKNCDGEEDNMNKQEEAEAAPSSEGESKDCDSNEQKQNTTEEGYQKTMEKFSLRKAILAKMGKINAEEATYELDKIARNCEQDHVKEDCIYLKKDDIASIRAIDGSEVLNQPNYRPDLYTPELRPQSVIAKTGVRKVNVDDGADIKFGVCTSGLTAGFVGLNNEIPSATMDWELKELKPKKMGCYVQIDYKALLQDRPDVENIILDDIVKALDQKKDEAIVKGSGENNEPTRSVQHFWCQYRRCSFCRLGS